MIQVTPEQKMEVINHYQFTGELLSQEPYGSGHINDTFLLVYDIERMGRMKVILQRMNKDIFTKPEELMENVVQNLRRQAAPAYPMLSCEFRFRLQEFHDRRYP